ncbi:MAG: guanylate kinase [Lewinellaceae bacterium]|nr:guanylate kinase [Lewinellaceae bacterium]
MKNGSPPPGKLIIFTAPSGAGKTTIVRHLLQVFPELAFSVSATTRAPRPHEEEGRDYYFLSAERFQQRIAEGAFVEWEEVYPGRYYGTLHEELERLWKRGKSIIFDIEVKGATRLKKAYPTNSLAIFVKPPSKETLFERLRNRATEDAESLHRRMERAEEELGYENNFDYILVNNRLPETLEEAERVVGHFLSHHHGGPHH